MSDMVLANEMLKKCSGDFPPRRSPSTSFLFSDNENSMLAILQP